MVQRLYRFCLTAAWNGYFRSNPIKYQLACQHIRAEFEVSRDLSDPHMVEQLLRDTFEHVLNFQNPDRWIRKFVCLFVCLFVYFNV
eukprot:TRINITY_DN6502_c0_g1_i1.p1 TRINITY_DN6502_c0_g1~~TRINITY_DN6502_c0_g1_i1.p1  ORF type:complete len:86 (-),score=9.01 TRINITY_DN6502_c0_g1_i1:338-595(-)